MAARRPPSRRRRRRRLAADGRTRGAAGTPAAPSRRFAAIAPQRHLEHPSGRSRSGSGGGGARDSRFGRDGRGSAAGGGPPAGSGRRRPARRPAARRRRPRRRPRRAARRRRRRPLPVRPRRRVAVRRRCRPGAGGRGRAEEAAEGVADGGVRPLLAAHLHPLGDRRHVERGHAVLFGVAVELGRLDHAHDELPLTSGTPRSPDAPDFSA